MTAGSWENGFTGLSWERRYKWQVSKETECLKRPNPKCHCLRQSQLQGSGKRGEHGCAVSQPPPPKEP